MYLRLVFANILESLIRLKPKGSVFLIIEPIPTVKLEINNFVLLFYSIVNSANIYRCTWLGTGT